MKSRMVCVLLALWIGASPGFGQDVVNLLTNGDFETGTADGWGGYGPNTREVVTEITGATVPEGVIQGDYCLEVTVTEATDNFWNAGVQTYYSQTFEAGKKYTLSLWLKCDEGERQINLKPELAQDPWTGYGDQQVTMTDEWAEYHVTTPVISANVTPAQISLHVGYGPGTFWIDYAQFYEGEYVPTVFGPRVAAEDPAPATDADDVPQDVVLAWEPGVFAATHNVYFGTDFDDVNNADIANPMGVLVSEGQPGTSFDPEGLLEFGQTYYWRVDEVNAPPDSAVFKGGVWSFTVEPYAYPVSDVTATASSTDKAEAGPENTVNGSGLNADDEHSTESEDMWVSSMQGPQPTWIQYAFDRVYTLDELWVWNYNGESEQILGYGFQDVTVEYSVDGEQWMTLDDVEFAQGTASDDYGPNIVVDMNDVMAQFVRLTANSNWSTFGLTMYGLSEVRFYYVPVRAREPQPVSGEKDLPVDPLLTWRPGRKAGAHDVYLSSDRQAVIDGNALVDTTTAASYAPAMLDYGQRYYWRVDEVNAVEMPGLWEGEVWSFATAEYMTVDDFESYRDDEDADAAIYQTWIDGFNDDNNGSLVGYVTSNNGTFAETDIVQSGNQSMPLSYDNTNSPYASFAYREFSPTQDWTANGVENLSLWVHGQAAGFAEVGDDGISMSGGGSDIWGSADEFRYAYKTLNGDGSIVAQVTGIGEGTNGWAKGGVMIRETLEEGSTHAFMCLTGGEGNGYSFQRRPVADSESTSDNGTAPAISPPHWVRLDREGDVFTAYVSPDGQEWTEVGTAQTIAMSDPVFVGLAVTSHALGELRGYSFDNIAATGDVTGSWQVEDVGLPQGEEGNSPADLYLVVEDSSGASVKVQHPDAGVVVTPVWDHWMIPLDSLTGVNLARVARLTISVGDPDGGTPGGTGLIFVDSIGVGRPLPPPPPIAGNLLENGGFEDGVIDPWGVTGATAEVVTDDVVEGDHALHVTVEAAGANFWDSSLNQGGHVFEEQKHYTLSAFMKCASGTLDINFKPELQQDPWTGYGEQVITITDEWAEYHVTTPVFEETTSPASLTFHCGFAAGEFWVDDVQLYEGDYVPTVVEE